jgi:thiamine pyrophosphokinase
MPRAIIFANGDLPEPERLRQRLRADDLVIAADGGSRHCQALGLRPHAVVGDLDSLSAEARSAFEQAGVHLESHPAHKDESDLELALLYAARQGATRMVIVGALGGRLDMTLANILLLTHPALASVRVEVWHGVQTAWLIRPPGDEVRGQAGDTLSLMPLNGDALGVVTRGLLYALANERLAFGPARGLSNVLTAATARVELRAGVLLAVHTPGRA